MLLIVSEYYYVVVHLSSETVCLKLSPNREPTKEMYSVRFDSNFSSLEESSAFKAGLKQVRQCLSSPRTLPVNGSSAMAYFDKSFSISPQQGCTKTAHKHGKDIRSSVHSYQAVCMGFYVGNKAYILFSGCFDLCTIVKKAVASSLPSSFPRNPDWVSFKSEVYL